MSLTSKNNEKIGAVNRGTPCESGLCNFCRTDCQGRCETWLSSLMGRRTLVPRDYGNATIGTENTTHVGVSYNALRIRGRVFGGAGLDPEKARTGDAAYCDADLTTAVGSNAKYPCDYPFLIGALSRNPVVDKYWDSFAVGAALCGIPLVIGENVGGGDNKTEFNPDGASPCTGAITMARARCSSSSTPTTPTTAWLITSPASTATSCASKSNGGKAPSLSTAKG